MDLICFITLTVLIIASYTDIKKRWDKFSRNKTFSKWNCNKPKEELIMEYIELDRKRRSAWYENPNGDVLISNPDYLIAQTFLAISFFGFFSYTITSAFSERKLAAETPAILLPMMIIFILAKVKKAL